MPFGTTMAGDVFQHKLDQSFGKIKQVIVIADDIVIVGKKPNHTRHDQALTTLLDTTRRCNVRLNYEKLQYKKDEVDFLVRLTPQVVASLMKVKLSVITKMPAPTSQETSTIIYRNDQLLVQVFR